MTDDDSDDTTSDSFAHRGRDDAPWQRMGRRDLLRIGAAGAATAIAGCSEGDGDDGGTEPSPDAPPSADDDADDGPESIPYADEYDTVVDVVADAGANPDGEESIIPVLEANASSDTLLFFPPGEYLMDGRWLLPSFEHLGLVGDEATIRPPRDYFGYLFIFGLQDSGASDVLFEGIDFDFTAANTAPRPLQAQVDDGITVRNVTVEGTSGTARFDVTTPQGSGVVSNLTMPDGMEIVETLDIPENGGNPDGVGVLVGPANRGRLRFEDCHVEGFPGNGLYASPSNGPIEVSGGLFANNGIASVRVSSPATIRNVEVRCDEAPQGFRNMRGIRLRHGESVLVENCRIVMRDLTYSDGGLVIEQQMESATIRDLEIDSSVDGIPAIHVKSPNHEQPDAEIEFERVQVTGEAGQGSAVQISDRHDCRLNAFDIEQSGPDRNGVYLVRTTDSVLRDSNIEVTGEPVVLEESELRQRNNRF
ncbi:hypothetical protein L593_05085 [Salinarchaeum sp. Harcht-Bsk1]|uniref:right-handed parallel beta-helix repeat-containing protein n=1 Tax=Salinarchaeum sp. Harcht-Bsk1 TaxID=1333523 RepID=UPI0003423AFC|nr:right-handed parallel beta-helix repeat-containing protein [Salinarchaeum sp. Harcht-Bsk1]AGN00966.1 hypothetical protein L593_05085 [Salinarchaeum sp. Harcht-Bsk1]